MSITLIIIIVFSLGFVAWGLFKPSRLYRFDCAFSLMFLAWLIPEMYIVEQSEFSRFLDFSFTWRYILACQLLVYLGFYIGKKIKGNDIDIAANLYSYDLRRSNKACVIVIAVGFVGFILMAGEVQETGLSGEWSGVVTFYYLLTQFILFGGALAWLIYLHTKQFRSLIIFLLMVSVAIPIVMYFARRGIMFQVAFATLAGAYLVTKYTPPRSIMVIGIVFGFVVLNTAGNIRSHIENENGTLVSAISSGAAVNGFNIFEHNPAPEVKSALTDIEIVRTTGNHEPFKLLWDSAVMQYIPAFLLGRDFKSSLLFDKSADSVIQRFGMDGATRTGFGEAYTGYWYFGTIIYFLIGLYQGGLWSRAERGDIRSQYYYVVIMNFGLLTITESISRFLVTLPIIYGVGYLVFRYIEKKTRYDKRGLEPSFPLPIL